MPRLSFRNRLVLLYMLALLPLLLVTGLVVYSLQQNYLINEARNRLVEFVRVDVEAQTGPDLTRLAVALGGDLRVLGADVFVKNATGAPVPPALGTGPWLPESDHSTARALREGKVKTITPPSGRRIVYLAPVMDAQGTVLGTVEASLPLAPIEDQMGSLRRWLILIMSLGAGVSVVAAFGMASVATRPLRALVGVAEQVARGEFSHRAALPEVSEFRSLAETFNTMLDRLQAALEFQANQTQEMRRFAADASHELRSPLAVFRGGMDMLEKAEARGDRAEVETILGLMRGEMESMTRLVEDLLFLARLDQARQGGQGVFVPAPVEPLPLLEEVVERAALLAPDRQVRLEWPRGPLPPVRADREMLRRALNNLLENALKYTPAGKQVTARIEPSEQGCRFHIQDEGEGIPAEILPRLFERFYRADEARSRSRPGAGLGLSIVQAIAEAHGGTISVASGSGAGSTFTLTVPYFPGGE